MKETDKNFDWVKREFIVADGLFEKIQDEFDPEDDDLKEFIPSVLEFMMDPFLYKDWWDSFKETKVQEFKEKHRETMDQLAKEREESIEKLTMTEDERIEAFVRRDLEIAELRKNGEDVFVIPDSYYEDLKAIRGFFNSTLAIYMSLLSKFIDLLDEHEYFWFDLSPNECLTIEGRLHNDLEPFGNQALLEEHYNVCESGCEDCKHVRNAKYPVLKSESKVKVI